jgi:hypothetical protein
MATSARQPTSIASVLIFFVLAVAIGLSYYHYPGGIALWVGLLLIALIEPAPLITGKRVGGGSMPSNDMERKKQLNYQSIKRISAWLFIPSPLIEGGFPETALVVVAVIMVNLALFPLRPIVIDLKNIPLIWLHLANGVLGSLALFSIYAMIRMRRRNPPLITLVRLWNELLQNDIVAVIVVAGVATGAGAIAGQTYASWLHASSVVSACIDACGGILFLLAAMSIWVRPAVQKEWMATMAAQDFWAEVWPSLKLSSEPSITSRKELPNEVKADSGSIHFSAGPLAIMSNPHLLAAVPSDTRLFRLYQMDHGAASSTEFMLVLWPNTSAPNIGDPENTPDLISLWFQGCITEALRALKIEAAIFVQASLMSAPDSAGAVYKINLVLATASVSIDKIYEHRAAIRDAVGSQFLIDMANEQLFCGDFANATYPDEATAKSVNDIFEIQAWTERLDGLKLPAQPTIISHEEIEPGIKIDTGTIHFSAGPQSILSNPRLPASVSADIQLFRMYVPDDSEPSTASATKFQLVSWPIVHSPNISDPSCDISIVKLWIEANITEALRAYSIETGAFVSLELISTPVSPSAVYLLRVSLTGAGVTLDYLNQYSSAVASSLGVELLVDPSQGVAFCGDFDNAVYAEPEAEIVIKNLMQENEWAERWHTVMDNPNDPAPYLDRGEVKRIETIDGGRFRLDMLPFAPRLSIPPSKYFDTEGKLATVLDSAPLVSVVPYLTYNRQNSSYERHARLFKVVWSKSRGIPTDPSKLKADEGGAALYVLWWKINQVFRGLGMELPDVYEAEVVNEQRPGAPNLWVIRMKFYGKVKFADIIGAQVKLEQAFQCAWLRVRATSVGADLFVGPSQEVMSQIYPVEVLDIVDDLDWEHAWRVARITGPDLSVPVKVESAHPPYNSRVTEYLFELPRGFTPGKVRAQVETLKTAAGLSYIDMSEVADSPNELRVIASREAPLPSMVPMDFASVDELNGQIPLGVSVTGEMVTFNRDNTPHLLVVGATGTGKAQPLDEELPVPISAHFPCGVATIGELEVGDLVYGLDGTPVTINALSPIHNERVYLVTFDSGHSIRCSGEHLWRVSRSRPGSDSTENMVDASGLMNIANPVKSVPSLMTAYQQEIEILTKSATGTDPTMRAVLTTSYLMNLVNAGQRIVVRSGTPVKGEIDSYFGMTPQEIASSLLQSDVNWLDKTGLQMLTHLVEGERRKILDELLARMSVRHSPPWVGVERTPGVLAYDILIALAGSLSVRIADDLNAEYTYLHRHSGLNGGLLFHTIRSIEVLPDIVPMRCIGVESSDHCYLAKGYIPTHNSVLTRTLIYGSLINGDQVYIIDPMKRATDLLAFKPYAHGFTTSNSRVEALGYLSAIYEEIKRRQEINHQYGAESGLSPSIPPEDRYPFILVELDEFAQLMAETNIPRNQVSSDPSRNQAFINAETENSVIFAIGQLVGAIAAVARSTLVTLVIATQRMDSAFLDRIPQGGNLKTNLGRVLLGSASIGERMSALRNVDTTPKIPVDAPKGRAVYEPVIGRGTILQSWYSSPEEIQEALAQRLTPIPPNVQLDPYAYVPVEMMRATEGDSDSPISIYVEEDATEIDDELFRDALSEILDAEVEIEQLPTTPDSFVDQGIQEPLPVQVIDIDPPSTVQDIETPSDVPDIEDPFTDYDIQEPVGVQDTEVETPSDVPDIEDPFTDYDIQEPVDTQDIDDPWELYDLEHPDQETAPAPTTITNIEAGEVLEGYAETPDSPRRERRRRQPITLDLAASFMEDDNTE